MYIRVCKKSRFVPWLSQFDQRVGCFKASTIPCSQQLCVLKPSIFASHKLFPTLFQRRRHLIASCQSVTNDFNQIGHHSLMEHNMNDLHGNCGSVCSDQLIGSNQLLEASAWLDGIVAEVSEEEKKIYSCQYCSYRTIYEIYLKNHLKKKHNIGWSRKRYIDSHL